MKRSIEFYLFLFTKIAYSASPMQMMLVEYFLLSNGSLYVRPIMKNIQQAKEKVTFKKDLDDFYTAITADKQDDEAIDKKYSSLSEKWGGDSMRHQLLSQAYNNYQLICITWRR